MSCSLVKDKVQLTKCLTSGLSSVMEKDMRSKACGLQPSILGRYTSPLREPRESMLAWCYRTILSLGVRYPQTRILMQWRASC